MLDLPSFPQSNAHNQMDGLTLLRGLPESSIPVVFFDPQYRGVLDRQAYGNEGKSRGRARSALPQMNSEVIHQFVRETERVLRPSGHLFLWLDKFELCSGMPSQVAEILAVVDLITWHKARFGMGYRTRRTCEYLLVAQKKPLRAKGVWQRHDIPDVWTEAPERRGHHPHRKPVKLQAAMIEAVTRPGELVIDPAAGSYSILESCQMTGRNFLGCDVLQPDSSPKIVIPMTARIEKCRGKGKDSGYT